MDETWTIAELAERATTALGRAGAGQRPGQRRAERTSDPLLHDDRPPRSPPLLPLAASPPLRPPAPAATGGGQTPPGRRGLHRRHPGRTRRRDQRPPGRTGRRGGPPRHARPRLDHRRHSPPSWTDRLSRQAGNGSAAPLAPAAGRPTPADAAGAPRPQKRTRPRPGTGPRPRAPAQVLDRPPDGRPRPPVRPPRHHHPRLSPRAFHGVSLDFGGGAAAHLPAGRRRTRGRDQGRPAPDRPPDRPWFLRRDPAATVPITPIRPDEVQPVPDAGLGPWRPRRATCRWSRSTSGPPSRGSPPGSAVTQGSATPTTMALEATYVFPLPPRAAVTAFRMEADGHVVEGVLKERGQARADYTQALQEGKRAAIAEEDRPDVFAIRVGNIVPGERVTVHLDLSQPLLYEDGARPSSGSRWSWPRATSRAARSTARPWGRAPRPTPTPSRTPPGSPRRRCCRASPAACGSA